MRKIYKIIGGMLITGTLVAGIGSGVAFAEYSTFEYGGETVLEGSRRFSKNLEYKIPAKNTATAQTEKTEETEEAGDAASEQKQVLNICQITIIQLPRTSPYRRIQCGLRFLISPMKPM